MEKKNFIEAVKEGAIKGYEQYDILPSLTIAQAILESAWGSSQLALKANNLFGIKAFSSWQGRRITMPTTEWYHGEKQTVQADFRAYDSITESILDHNKLLSYSRYEPVRQCTSFKEACNKVYECGYATDPDYAAKLIRLIEENQLYLTDSMDLIDKSTALREAAAEEDGQKVLKFQKLCNELGMKDSTGKALIEDNILGWRTLSCINYMPELAWGSRGQAVKYVQAMAGAEPVDGIFGQITRTKVMEYQSRKGLYVDGIVGERTWKSFLMD